MPESMGIDMGQIVSGGEVVEPPGNTVRAHAISIVLGEDIASVHPSIAVCQLETELLLFVLPE